MRFRQHSTCATRSIWSFKVGQEWSSWISAVTSSLVIMMPSLPCQQFMGCRCSFSWDNAGRKSTWVTQMPHGEELNQLDAWSVHVHAGQRKAMKNMSAERECTIISFPPVIDVNVFHLEPHRPSRVNFLMSKTSPRIPSHPECTGCRWLNVPADINATLSHLLRSDSQARHFPPSKSSSRIPAHELEAQMVLEIIGWVIPVIGVTPSSKGRKEGSTTWKERRNATPPKEGGNQAAPPNRREGERCLTQRRWRKATPPNGRRKNSNMTEKRRRRPSSTTQQKTWKKQLHPNGRKENNHTKRKRKNSNATQKERGNQAAPPKGGGRQHHQTGEGKTATPPTEGRDQAAPRNRRQGEKAAPPKGGDGRQPHQKEQEKQQHHPKGRKKPSSTTQQKREDKHHYPKQEKEGNTKQKKSKQQHHHKKEHEQIWEYLSLSVLVRLRDCALESTRISVSRQRSNVHVTARLKEPHFHVTGAMQQMHGLGHWLQRVWKQLNTCAETPNLWKTAIETRMGWKHRSRRQWTFPHGSGCTKEVVTRLNRRSSNTTCRHEKQKDGSIAERHKTEVVFHQKWKWWKIMFLKNYKKKEKKEKQKERDKKKRNTQNKQN